MDRERLLAHLTDDTERLLGARTLDWVEKSLRDGKPEATPFLDPAERELVHGLLGSLDGIAWRNYGGYPKAERQRVVMYPDYFLAELIEMPVRAVEVSGDFQTPPSHRDVLGSVLGLGIARGQIGDILPTGNGAQVIVASELVDFIITSWDRVGRVRVRVDEIDLERLDVEPERIKEIRTTVASMRLDALAAAGYGTSRTKMAKEIRMERVKVNWKPVTNPAAEVKEGDVLSIRGRGRVVVQQLQGTTRKGRISVVLQRYM